MPWFNEFCLQNEDLQLTYAFFYEYSYGVALHMYIFAILGIYFHVQIEVGIWLEEIHWLCVVGFV